MSLQSFRQASPTCRRDFQAHSTNKWALCGGFYALQTQRVGLAALFSPRSASFAFCHWAYCSVQGPWMDLFLGIENGPLFPSRWCRIEWLWQLSPRANQAQGKPQSQRILHPGSSSNSVQRERSRLHQFVQWKTRSSTRTWFLRPHSRSPWQSLSRCR